MDNRTAGQFSAIVGPENLIQQGELLTVSPGNADEISRILAIANQACLPVWTKASAETGLLLSLSRLNKIIEIDPANLTATVEPGVRTADLNLALEKYGLQYSPVSGSLSGDTLGEAVSAGAWSISGAKYGVQKHFIMGLETVLADGRIVKSGGKNVKDVAGYDLSKLFTGSGSTLGIIAKLTVKLLPLPENRQAIVASFTDSQQLGRLLENLRSQRIEPACFEILSPGAAEFVLQNLNLPQQDNKFLLLIEADGIQAVADKHIAVILSILKDIDAAILATFSGAADCNALRSARTGAFTAAEAKKPASRILDIMLPKSTIPAMLEALCHWIHLPDFGVFAHPGDGNLLCILSWDPANAAESALAGQIADEVLAATHRLGGSTVDAEPVKDGAAAGAMQLVKQALDPKNILNPYLA